MLLNSATVYETSQALPVNKYYLAMGTKNGAMPLFQSKICPKLKAQILQMRLQNVQEGLSFTAERKNCEIFNLSSYFHPSKIVFFRFFKA